MSFKISQTVTACWNCPHATTNVREHDDPFTSSPANTYWMCKASDMRYIPNEHVIPAFCPKDVSK